MFWNSGSNLAIGEGIIFIMIILKNIVETIVTFFESIITYINYLTELISDLTQGDLTGLLLYLWKCIPEAIQSIFISAILLLLFVGFIHVIQSLRKR